MKISCQCVTYGRVDLLEESIACFLNQTYPDREMVILNTLPDQTFIFNHPLVKIVNLKERPKSLGDARNLCVSLCSGDVITCWDDDNFFLPRQLEIFASGFDDHSMWVRLSKMFYVEHFHVGKIVEGEANLFAYRREAFDATDGYPSETCGEDRLLNNEIRAAYPGTVINLQAEDVTHCYCWGNGVYHASGQGDEGASTAHSRMELDIKKKIKDKLIPTGEILLKPAIKHDVEDQCKKVIARLNKKHEQNHGSLQHA